MSAIESIARENRMALRRLLAQPAGTVATVLLLVLGAAPLIAVLALYVQITTGELPFAQADRLVHLTARAEKLSWDVGLSRPLIADLRPPVGGTVSTLILLALVMTFVFAIQDAGSRAAAALGGAKSWTLAFNALGLFGPLAVLLLLIAASIFLTASKIWIPAVARSW